MTGDGGDIGLFRLALGGTPEMFTRLAQFGEVERFLRRRAHPAGRRLSGGVGDRFQSTDRRGV